jgi:hypothetical protein
MNSDESRAGRERTARPARDVIAHQSVVPWPSQLQVEQDLLLCRAMVALFDDSFLQSRIAMRGGTLLHKVHLAPASRYSEDIDLVVVGNRPESHILKDKKSTPVSAAGAIRLLFPHQPPIPSWPSIKTVTRIMRRRV